MKRLIAVTVVLILMFNLTGCEALRKKFTRKKKETVKMPRFYQVRKYEKKPTPELYKKHYAYWASWHDELIRVLGQNHKKDMMCILNAVENLKDMQGILIPEKGDELEPHIKRLLKVKDAVFKEELSQANKSYIMMTLEREGRFIKREFCYSKVRNSLRKSFDETSPPVQGDDKNAQEGQGPALLPQTMSDSGQTTGGSAQSVVFLKNEGK
jgi:hypothetical protein